jgi:hypothetical protein
MLPGIDVILGGTKFLVPPLSLGSLELFQKRLAAFQGGIDPESVGTVIDVALAAINRNYPEMTREQLGAILDLSDMAEVMQAVMDVAGIRRKAAAEEKAKASNLP